MEALASSASRDGTAKAPPGEYGVLPSQVMPELLSQLTPVEPLVVLDAGFGMPETVAFFGQRRCRLHFCGLADTIRTVLQTDQSERNETVWLTAFRQALDFPPETVLDFCLFWDLFNYLEDDALRGLTLALAPFLGNDTRGHGFIAPNRNAAVPGRVYSLADEQQIILRPAPPVLSSTWPRPHGRLGKMLEGLEIGHSVLRQGGLLEISLKATK